MQQIWNLYPSGPLADAVAAHLDRAGVCFSITDTLSGSAVVLAGALRDAESIARRIIMAEGKEFVPITPGECLEKAVRLGLFPAKTDWNTPMTREEAAILAVRLLSRVENL